MTPQLCALLLLLLLGGSLSYTLRGRSGVYIRKRKQPSLAVAPQREGSIIVPPGYIKKDHGGSNEYGIRQLTMTELISYISKIRKLMKVPSGTLNLEMFEMLESLEIIANALNSKKHPFSNELYTFGDFNDGQIDCCGAVRLKKGFPNEMDVYVVLNYPHMNQEATSNMIMYIDEMSKENAILVNYKPLRIYSSLKDSLNKVKPNLHNDELNIDDNDESCMFIDSNRPKFSLILDTIPLIDLGRFWYQVEIPNEKPVYIKQKLECLNEFELCHAKPTTLGGGLLVLDSENARTIYPQATTEFFQILTHELEHKLPNLHVL